MSEALTSNLKPCPFCGGAAEIVERDVEPQQDSWYGKTLAIFAKCKTCGACLFDQYFHDGFGTNDDAAAAWNRRAPMETPGTPERR